MAFVATATAVGFGSAVLGTAIIGAGVGGLYSAITKDGDVLNSMLTGGLIGAGVGAMLPAAAGATAAGGLSAVPTAAGGASPALVAAQGATAATTPAQLNAIAAAQGVAAEGAMGLPGLNMAAAPELITPGIMQGSGAVEAAGMTGKQKLAAGLAGTTALSLLGGRNQPTIQEQESNSYIRPYTYSQKRNPNYGLPGESYFTQSYEAGEPYKAARGGIMRMAEGGAAQPIVPMQQLAAPVNTYSAPQRPVSQAVTDYNQLLAQRAQNEYNVQPAPLSTLPGGGERAGAADTQKLINQYYLANLGRQGDQPGLGYFTNRKMTTGESLADINKAIQGSNEGQVFSAYKDLLGRRPDAGGSENYQKLLASGMSNEDLRKSIMGSQEYLSKNPEKTAYNAAPITAENFDEADYRSRYADAFQGPGRAYQHYLEANAAGDVRTANKRPFQQTSAPSGQSGYSYDPVTKRFTAPTSAAPAQESGGLTDITQDPGFQSFMQNQYRNYQQAQSGGGAAGGLMPGSLKYAVGGDIQSYNLGGYSDGGRLLRGPGDGVSDDIPATIGNRQPARLADGEFVIPARIVSELGNGSTDAGAKRLYAMMDRIQAGRKKTVGKGNIAKDTKAKKHLLA